MTSDAFYIMEILKDKIMRQTKVYPGEFLFDVNGEFVGIYVGNNTMQIIYDYKIEKEDKNT